jgi:hypothetical protein
MDDHQAAESRPTALRRGAGQTLTGCVRGALVVVPVLEVHTVVDRLSDTPPGGAPLVVVERIVDASVQPGDGRFRRRLVERAERARLLGRHQVVIGVEGVGERLVSEEVGEDGCGRP